MKDLVIFKDGAQELVDGNEMAWNMSYDGGFNAYITFMFGTAFIWDSVAWFEV